MNRRAASQLLVLAPLAACARRAQRPAPTLPIAPSATAFDAGPVEDYAPGRAVRFRNTGVIVIHDERGVLAVSALCTHQGCLLDIAEITLACPCHGSEFSMQGDVLSGPAERPLVHFKVTTFARRVHVDTTVVVAATERLIL